MQEIAQWLPAGYKQLDEEQHAKAAEAMQNYVTSADLLKQLCQGGNNSSWLMSDPGRPISSLHALACYLHIMANCQQTHLQRSILHTLLLSGLPITWSRVSSNPLVLDHTTYWVVYAQYVLEAGAAVLNLQMF